MAAKNSYNKSAKKQKPQQEAIVKTSQANTEVLAPEKASIKKQSEPSFYNKNIKPNIKQISSVLAGLIAIIIILWFSFAYIPAILDQTDEAKSLREKKELEEKTAKENRDQQERLLSEARELKLDEKNQWLTELKIRIGQSAETNNLKINLKNSYAPKTVENFIRLVYRKYYNGTSFHRMVVEDNFKVLQGGDPKGNGTGGESATKQGVPDELWEIAPTYSPADSNGNTNITNDPKFRDPSLYANLDKNTGTVTYRKGLILMAKSASPDSATSQFFITLDTTILPAQYTVFGVLSEESLPVLDKILAEVKPQTGSSNPTAPDKNIKIEEINIL